MKLLIAVLIFCGAAFGQCPCTAGTICTSGTVTAVCGVCPTFSGSCGTNGLYSATGSATLLPGEARRLFDRFYDTAAGANNTRANIIYAHAGGNRTNQGDVTTAGFAASGTNAGVIPTLVAMGFNVYAFQYSLSPLGKLSGAINASQTAFTITSDACNKYFPTASGYVLFAGPEQINITGQTGTCPFSVTTSTRAFNGTTATSHADQDWVTAADTNGLDGSIKRSIGDLACLMAYTAANANNGNPLDTFLWGYSDGTALIDQIRALGPAVLEASCEWPAWTSATLKVRGGVDFADIADWAAASQTTPTICGQVTCSPMGGDGESPQDTIAIVGTPPTTPTVSSITAVSCNSTGLTIGTPNAAYIAAQAVSAQFCLPGMSGCYKTPLPASAYWPSLTVQGGLDGDVGYNQAQCYTVNAPHTSLTTLPTSNHGLDSTTGAGCDGVHLCLASVSIQQMLAMVRSAGALVTNPLPGSAVF